MGFFVASEEELEAAAETIQDAAIENAAAGVTSFSSDGASASAIDPMKQLEFARELRRDSVSTPLRTMRHGRIISPGCGG
jgi:hypothetical protein